LDPDSGCEKFADPDPGLHFYPKLVFIFAKEAKKELWTRIKMRIRNQIQGFKKMQNPDENDFYTYGKHRRILLRSDPDPM